MSTAASGPAKAVSASAGTWGTDRLPKVDFGSGCYITDTDGRRYLDGSAGPAVFALGHAHPEINQAIKDQLDRIAHGYRYTFTSDPLEELTELVAEACGDGLKHMTFTAGGSEAVEACLKIALQYQTAIGCKSRRLFISRDRSWHGNTIGAMSVSGFRDRRAAFEGAMLPVSFLSPVNAYRPPHIWNQPAPSPEAVAAHCAGELEQEILRLGKDRVAAFIFEPVVGAAGGCVPAPPGYARMIRKICDEHGVLMIADEVMCGAARCGTWRALEHDRVVPDIMAVAKGLGAGYIPLGAAIYHERLHDPMIAQHGGLLTGHTFTGHTLACAAGAAVQRIVKRDGLAAKVEKDGAYFADLLRQAFGQVAQIGDIRGRGFFWATEFVKDRETKEPFPAELALFQRVRERAFKNGLICYPMGGNVDGKKGDIVILSPPYIATRGELGEIVERLQRSVAEVLGELGA